MKHYKRQIAFFATIILATTVIFKMCDYLQIFNDEFLRLTLSFIVALISTCLLAVSLSKVNGD